VGDEIGPLRSKKGEETAAIYEGGRGAREQGKQKADSETAREKNPHKDTPTLQKSRSISE
jgi:hypothetical protein